MLSICMQIKPESRFDDESKMEQESLLDQLSQALVDAGLVADVEEGLVYIVPAFAKFDLLV